MFNERHRRELAHFLSLHGFQQVDRNIHLRIFNLRQGQVTLEIKFNGGVEIITRGASRRRVEDYSWSPRHRDIVRIIIETETSKLKNLEIDNRLENAAGTLV